MNKAMDDQPPSVTSPQPLAWNRAPEAPVLKSHEVDLVWVQIDLHRRKLPYLKSVLSLEEKERAQAFKFDLHRERFIIRRGLLRQRLASYTGQPADRVPIVYSESGKPFLPPDDNPADLHFSLSHRNDTALFAFTRHHDMGVDLEFLAPASDLLDLAEHHFAPQEFKTLRNTPVDQQNHRFYELWTCKEAYLKGRGIIPLEQFTIATDASGRTVLAQDETDAEQRGRWQFHSFEVDSQHLAALAVRTSNALTLRYWTL